MHKEGRGRNCRQTRRFASLFVEFSKIAELPHLRMPQIQCQMLRFPASMAPPKVHWNRTLSAALKHRETPSWKDSLAIAKSQSHWQDERRMMIWKVGGCEERERSEGAMVSLLSVCSLVMMIYDELCERSFPPISFWSYFGEKLSKNVRWLPMRSGVQNALISHQQRPSSGKNISLRMKMKI